MSDRYISDHVREDLLDKFIFLAGPRQVGKTTFVKNLHEKHEYFNYDIPSDRLHPFDLKELANQGKPEEILSGLLRLSGFPEPFTNRLSCFLCVYRS